MADRLPLSKSHETIRTNGIDIHAVTAGPVDGSPVLLLHGFPEFWYGWRHQIPSLVEAGYRVIAPDQRGYNRSDKPRGIDQYTIDQPMFDALGILDHYGYDTANFVGHDWGAGVVWQLLLRHPERVNRAVTVNVPHPEVYREYFTRSPCQLLRSWYIFFFQLPRLPEWLCRIGDWRGLRWFTDTSNREDTFTESTLDRYREAWSRRDAVTGMINWYRAMIQESIEQPTSQMAGPPALLIWGPQDPYMDRAMARPSIDYCSTGHLERIEDGTHWVHHELPDRVNAALLDFLE